ncbi:hypothetical protein MN116_004369 [Schistosoma mekongi]|uniref:Intraflagellar transport protein 56 n=1 Tax=Schistosoma mekongi TaxID=38744 RepID=A0AAE1ZG19_SCHME|nr:hypothetical protein MN116_004369 [Schistosoma mekongi]
MILSRSKPALQKQRTIPMQSRKIPSLQVFIEKRDFTGALALLEFERCCSKSTVETDLWIAYSAFHLGDYKKAAEEYKKLVEKTNAPPDVHTYLACCYFFLGMYQEALNSAKDGPASRLQSRLLFHIAQKFNDEKTLLNHHKSLENSIEDQLSLASVHCLKNRHQEAIDIYKRILLDNREYLALNVNIALCYYKMDYYDISQEVLGIYQQRYPDSATAVNLKACINFRSYNGKAAEAELESLQSVATSTFSYAQDLIKHNLVVFRNGEGALQVLPPLLDVLPEARLNLIIFHLKNDQLQEAYELTKEIDPSTPQEYVIKGVVNAILGQEHGSREHLKQAQQYFQLVGGSASECDTISGRQCMSSCFFLLRQFDDVLIYLNSIKSYFYNDDIFNFNYAQAKAAVGAYKEAKEVFLLIQSEQIRSEYTYLSWLARCYIMTKQARLAWELYLKMETSAESFSVLQLIANDCYKMTQFYYAAKAFDVLERLDQNPEYWEGKRGACVGVFQLIIDGQEPKERLREVIQILRTTNNPQTEYLVHVMKKYAKENKIVV